jgi:hypothetical protein
VFRHQPGEAPRLRFEFQPAPIAINKWKTFSLRFAFAFSAVAVAAAAGAWNVLQKNFPAGSDEIVFVSVPADPEPILAEREADKSPVAQPASEVPGGTVKVRAVQESPKAVRILNKAPKQPPARKSQRPVLTAEEQYAYDEVRKALSISSEKLRIVKDTIDGKETPGRINGR